MHHTPLSVSGRNLCNVVHRDRLPYRCLTMAVLRFCPGTSGHHSFGRHETYPGPGGCRTEIVRMDIGEDSRDPRLGNITTVVATFDFVICSIYGQSFLSNVGFLTSVVWGGQSCW